MSDERKPAGQTSGNRSGYHSSGNGQKQFGENRYHRGSKITEKGPNDRNGGKDTEVRGARRFGRPGNAKQVPRSTGTEKDSARNTQRFSSEDRKTGFHRDGEKRAPSGRRPSYPGQERRFERRTEPLSRPPKDGLDPRRVALNVIRAVTEEGAWASLVLDRELTKAGLSPQDRRLAARLSYDTIDHLLYLDWVLSQVMAREDTDIRLRNILRLGACQLLFFDRIPDMAATDTSVKLCKELGMEGLAGVCNGILRNLIRKREELVFPDRETEPIKYLSIQHSVPEFLVQRLVDDYGWEEADRLMALTGRDMAITIRPNLMVMDDAKFEKMLEGKVWEKERGMFPHVWKIRNMANVGSDSDFLSGHFSIQSEPSQVACLALNPRRGWNVLDACAAPGGKSCYLAELMDGTGRVHAWEVHEHRTRLIEAQVKRLGLENVRPVTRDATQIREEMAETMDAVLLDAPCTGTGEMHDKPDSRYRMKEENVEELVHLQKRLLEATARLVKKGGVLVYSTCSILTEENEKQVEAFLQQHPDFVAEDLPETIPEAIRARRKLGVQLLPGKDADGGFYICRMRRKRI